MRNADQKKREELTKGLRPKTFRVGQGIDPHEVQLSDDTHGRD